MNRYHRQMLVPGVGEEGQQKLLASRVLLVGCGGLGTTLASLLARAGVGHLVIADRDFVELTNLPRQVLFTESDAEQHLPKAEAARRHLAEANSQVQIDAVVDDVSHQNLERLADGCDLLLDGTDNFETRFLLNDAAVKLGLPYVYGGAVGTSGMMLPILPHTPAGDRPWETAGKASPCLRCLFGEAPPPGSAPTCDTAGVLNSTVSIVASWQVSEAIKILLGQWDAVADHLLSLDFWHNSVRQLDVTASYQPGECPCCGQRQFEYLTGRLASRGRTLCGRGGVQLTQYQRRAGQELDLEAIARRLAPHGEVKRNPFMLRVELDDAGNRYTLTLFPDGRAIVQGTQEPSVAKSLYARYVGV
ncbi:MAG: ThiF family adenylyltransferase [Phycisphaeraceae bacterium]